MTNVPRRFDLQVLKNKSTTDSAQVPAVGASVSGFESGATAAQATLLQSINTDPPPPQIQFVRVYSPESIRPGDTIRVGPGGPELPVAQVVTVGPNSFDIGLDYTLTTNTDVPLGTRLYNMARPLPASSDPAGLLPLAWPSLTDGLGRAGFYARALKFDYLVQSSDFSPRGYVDFNGSAPREVNWVCATDYASLQDAVGALTAAGVVYIPPGTYTPTSVPAFVPPLEVNLTGTRIIGAGPRSTRLRYFWTEPNWDNNRDLIRLNRDHQSVEDLELQHGAILPPPGGQYGTGAGIRVRAAVDQLSYATAVRNVWIESTPSYGLVFESRPGSTTWAVYGTIDDLVVYKCQNPNHGGIFVGPAQTTTIFFKNCVVREASGAAVRIDGAQGISFLDCTFDTCITGMRLNGSSNVQIRGCWFEYLQVAPWIELVGQCDGITVADSTFRQLLQGNPEIVRVGSGSRAVTLSGLHISQPSLGTTPHVVVGANSVVSILPCVVRSGGTAHDLLVQDASSKSVLLGAMSRIRIPVITSAEKLALQEVKSGDLIVLDTGTAKVAQIYDGSTWRDWRAHVHRCGERRPHLW